MQVFIVAFLLAALLTVSLLFLCPPRDGKHEFILALLDSTIGSKPIYPTRRAALPWSRSGMVKR